MNESTWYQTFMPKEVGTVFSLREMGLTEIPESISQYLLNVTVLDLSFNSLTSLPASLGSCVNLQEIWVNNNQLTSLPDLSGLSLTRLDVSHNKLTSISNINSIIIDAAHNELTSISNLGHITSIINLDHNQLTDIETPICQLPNLQILNICNNPINSVESISSQFTRPLSEFWS
jgi:Leucine-rich repeat (LRR) protein